MAEPSVAIPIAPKVDLTGLPDKFSGQFFKHWQQRMKIWLTMKGLLAVIQVIRPKPTDTDPKIAEIVQWTERDQIGRGAILLALSNTLFDVYCFDSYTAKSLWDELDRKYNTEKQGLEKYFVSKFMRYQMVEDRSVAEQTHEIINLEHALADAEMKLPEKFLVMSIVDKFPKSWENFGMTLKHEKGRLSLDDLMIAISIEEEHRNQTHKMPAKTGQAVVNMVVGGSSGASTLGATEGYASVQPELLTIYEPCDWLIDIGANMHVCADKSLFVSYQAITGKTISMGDSSTTEVLGIGSVDLKFPSGRILSLKRVHHIPTVRRNIISGSIIVREGYELAFKFNKVVIQQFGISVGKGRKPSLKYFRVWGCLAKVLVPEHKRNKLGPKTVDAVFLGYVETSYALRFLVIKSEIPGIEVNTIVEFRNAVFLEDVFPMKIGIPSSVSLDDSLASTSIPEHVEKMTNVGVNPNSTSLTNEESDIPRRSKRARVVKDFGSDFVTYNIEDNPLTFKDAMASSEAKQWKEAVKSEMDSIVSNGTWVLVDLAPGCTTIGCKWIFKKKLKPDGSIDKFKAKLVAKGFKQKEGIDFFDTYSSVARLTTIRVLIGLASVYNLSIHQMDVKTTTFLYGELEEEIYMDQPEGFVAHGNERKVCKLVKSLYGLKQAPKQWHEKFDQTILAFGFTINENDKCIYCKVKGDRIIILCLYVDDILLIGSCIEIIIETKSFLKNKFEMKDMGEADGTKVPEGHSVTSHSLWQIPVVLEGYSDASWIAKNSGSNGCSGYVFTLGGDAVSWKSAKQTFIIRSTFEAELCAFDTTGTEAEWLFGLLSQLPIVSQPLPPIAVHCDSKTTIAKVRSRKYNQKTKRHIQVRLKSTRALVSDRVIGIDFVGTKDNVADPLIKGLDLSQVNKSRLGMGLKTHQ
ncbi:UNVERIFIED_CONTAM: Retrovirus-related Pol polyprotein from transposon TNT 1-94 [Sesamum angustifolium]|uniref:Retrovirus-related Pol polyprotein from transposon TNT 1-94 n=1 Tax=Sesamum angustifolium TaxID=2727405 RepID=A0AAW2JZE8_9LAMI